MILECLSWMLYDDTSLGQSWPELLGVLFHASQSADAGQREVAFRIFATTPGIIQRQHEDAVQNVFAKGFKDENVDVRNPPVLSTLVMTTRC